MNSDLAVESRCESFVKSLRVLNHFIKSFLGLVNKCVVFLDLSLLGLDVQVDGLSLPLKLGDLVVELSLLNSLLHDIGVDLIAANLELMDFALE